LVFTNEFWTSKQRAASSLHEVSYRACFKPQLPRFFVERLTETGDLVYDPFMGRGTTLLESALLGRSTVGCDINPLSAILLRPRLNPPTLEQVQQRLHEINWEYDGLLPEELPCSIIQEPYPSDTRKERQGNRAVLDLDEGAEVRISAPEGVLPLLVEHEG
jgi:hypothetical protein